MSPDGPIKLVSQLLDLAIVDSDGCHCGIVDDVELAGGASETLEVNALLVGPGAYSGRVPRWVMSLIRMTVGNRVIKVPWSKVGTIGASVQLKVSGKSIGLARSEERMKRWVPRRGAL